MTNSTSGEQEAAMAEQIQLVSEELDGLLRELIRLRL
jgi:hypothetical protein